MHDIIKMKYHDYKRIGALYKKWKRIIKFIQIIAMPTTFSTITLGMVLLTPRFALCNWRVKSQLAFIKLVVIDSFHRDQRPGFPGIRVHLRGRGISEHIHQFWENCYF
jgi:hypothetical protein